MEDRERDHRMSEDLIRRSDAIEAIASLHILADEEKIFKVYANNPHSMTTDFEGTLIDAINAIKSIPSADRPQGEWILECDAEGEGDNLYRCSECGQRYGCQEYDIPNFCPYCGARMKGEADE